MSLLLVPFVELFRYSLQPIAPFTWFGVGLSTLDIVATFRLCIILRQIREIKRANHISAKGAKSLEEDSLARKVITTLLVVYGGEAITGPFLGIPPSFMVSGVVPILYTVVQAIVEYLPSVPVPSLENEMPLAVVDGVTRAYLLCNLIPPAVTTNSSPLIAASPWTLLITSLITANAGFFFTNFFDFLSPTSLSVQTPPELQAYGWTTADLWCAPVTTGLYALLTHAQPFWEELHNVLSQMLGSTQLGETVKPLDPEQARAVCAFLLASLFVGRTGRNFGLWKGYTQPPPIQSEKEKVQ